MNFYEKSGLPEFENLSRDDYTKVQLQKIVDKYKDNFQYSNGLCGMFSLALVCYFSHNDVYVGLNVAHSNATYYSPDHSFVSIGEYYMDHIELSTDSEQFSLLEYGGNFEEDYDYAEYDIDFGLEYEDFANDISDFTNNMLAMIELVDDFHKILQLNPVTEKQVTDLYEEVLGEW